jgi:hypothetical protein
MERLAGERPIIGVLVGCRLASALDSQEVSDVLGLLVKRCDVLKVGWHNPLPRYSAPPVLP